jgi:hypothetical protein
MSVPPLPEDPSVDADQSAETLSKSGFLAEVNDNTLRVVRRADNQLEWEFFCECGHHRCEDRVFLTIDAYLALRETGDPVLAPGHELTRAERARRQSGELRDESTAHRGQARHQMQRAIKRTDGR